MTRPNLFPIVFFIILALAGCGNRNVFLRGKITFVDDDSPLKSGIVTFSTPTFTARGTILQDGTYRVGSLGVDDGLPPGEYAVSITGATGIVGTARNAEGDPLVRLLIDEKYANTATSGLKVKVDRTTTVYDIRVERNRDSVK